MSLWETMTGGGGGDSGGGGIPILSTASDLYGQWRNERAQKEQNKANAGLARWQARWQKNMSDTAVTRAAADMRNAGINPLMAAGSQASTPSGASAHMERETSINPFNSLMEGNNSGLTIESLKKNLSQKDATKKLTDAQYNATDAQRFLNEANTALTASKANEHILTRKGRADATNASSKALVNEAKTREAVSEVNRMQAEQDRKFMKFDNLNNRIKAGLGTVNSAMDAIVPIRNIGRTNVTTERYNSQGEHTGTTTTRRH